MKHHLSLEQVIEAYGEALGDFEQAWISVDEDVVDEFFGAVSRFRASDDGGVVFLLEDHRSDLVGAQCLAETLEEDGSVLRVDLHEVAEGALLAVVVAPAGEVAEEAAEEEQSGSCASSLQAEGDRRGYARPTAHETTCVDPGQHGEVSRPMPVADPAVQRSARPPVTRATSPRRQPTAPRSRQRLRHVPVSITVQPVPGGELRLLSKALAQRAVAGFDPLAWEPTEPRLSPWQHSLYCLGAVTVDRWERLIPTQAGVLALGAHPHRHFPGAQVVVHRGRDREVWWGSLPQILQRARECTTLVDVLGEELVERMILHAWLCRLWRDRFGERSLVLRVADDGFTMRYPGHGAPVGNRLREQADAGLREIVSALGYRVGDLDVMAQLADRVVAIGGEPPTFTSRAGEVVWKIDWPWQLPGGVGADVEAEPYRSNAEEDASCASPRGEPQAAAAPRVPFEEQRPSPVDAELALRGSSEGGPRSIVPPIVEPSPPPPVRVIAQLASGAERARAPSAERPRPQEAEIAPRHKGSAARTRRRRQSRAQREAALLAHLNSQGPQTTRDLVAALGWTRSTMRSVLAGLVDSGKVMGESESARSPFQRYAAC